ncbi:chromate transporter [Aneurinibacillus sp. Ricciae_BoGa-3]|uniref:chromate transporter n=1 Tax=Aneurinibacillus sp. Ricciae_BoGa-3 TaxID=3022697 RepID=UPI002340ACA1|nr:chromate transporter [Aneurinibacillus sp. Ricciae_BoGa-3]WCK54540.1 chromate transporter [Aneurinibacillus sp. Ricciae_BoGa-3]
MIYLQIFWAFFIANILGYGGGPSSIPLIQNEVVSHYHWMTVQQFGETLALANALPSPINTKLGGYIGYQVAGVSGAIIAFIATVAPTAIAMIILLKSMNLFKDAPQVKSMTQSIRPIIAVLLGVLAYQFFQHAVMGAGWIHTIILSVASYILLERIRINPAIVIAASMIYGMILIK